METKRKVLDPAHVKKKPVESPYSAYKKEVNRLLSKSQTGGGWGITFTCNEYLEDTTTAKCTYHMMDRWVRFSFNSKLVKTTSQARNAAKHEFGHFVTARIDRLALYRHTTEAEIDEELEAIARVFEKLV